MREDTITRFPPRRLRLGLAGAALLAIGGVAGGLAGHAIHPPIEMAPIRPVPIAKLAQADGIVTIRGKVAEAYGNRYVIDDGTGRTLIDTGRGGEGRSPLAIGTALTVQGHVHDGFLRASFLVDQAGAVTAVGPIGGPRHEGPGWHERFDHGPGMGDGPPPPPPPPPPAAGDAGPAGR